MSLLVVERVVAMACNTGGTLLPMGLKGQVANVVLNFEGSFIPKGHAITFTTFHGVAVGPVVM